MASDPITKGLSDVRGYLGTTIYRLEYAIENLSNNLINTEASLSRVADTDYAKETVNLARNQIVQQASTTMLAQANVSGQAALSLLKQNLY